jgi:hypothetical protein
VSTGRGRRVRPSLLALLSPSGLWPVVTGPWEDPLEEAMEAEHLEPVRRSRGSHGDHGLTLGREQPCGGGWPALGPVTFAGGAV